MSGRNQPYTYNEVASRFYNLADVSANENPLLKPFADDFKKQCLMLYNKESQRNEVEIIGGKFNDIVDGYITSCVDDLNKKMQSDGGRLAPLEEKNLIKDWLDERAMFVFENYVPFFSAIYFFFQNIV